MPSRQQEEPVCMQLPTVPSYKRALEMRERRGGAYGKTKMLEKEYGGDLHSPEYLVK